MIADSLPSSQKKIGKCDAYGLIVYHQNIGEEPVFHISQRRDTLSYIHFIQGKVPIEKFDLYFSRMTREEKERIMAYSFEDLWMDLFSDRYFRNIDQFTKAKTKLEIYRNRIEKSCQSMLNISIELDWGFPKGRKRHSKEPDLVCALREYREETKNRCYLEFVDCPPLIFSHPLRSEKIAYYIARSKFRPCPKYYSLNFGNIQRTSVSEETSDLRWVSLLEAAKIIPEMYYGLLQEIDIVFKQNRPFLLLQDAIVKYGK